MGTAHPYRDRALALAGAALLAMASSLTLAQTAPAPAKAEDTGFFGSGGRSFDQQFNGAKDAVSNFGHEAGVAAKTTADTAKDAAKDAADTITKKLPATSVVSGH